MTAGTQAGAIIGIFTTLFFNFFNMAMNTVATYEIFAMDAGITIVSSAIIGVIIAAVNGKMR
ncbi:MAG: hypothetical protein CVU03_11385 [Bacteroidetes bacterium HGW-Bacteroidetes-2]|jgi:hypothetical protein|nr:MAG: hypothetical protein CVU03_11385 [Bacteroidetes bacterium HGW-Bacteroidetes-2]